MKQLRGIERDGLGGIAVGIVSLKRNEHLQVAERKKVFCLLGAGGEPGAGIGA